MRKYDVSYTFHLRLDSVSKVADKIGSHATIRVQTPSSMEPMEDEEKLKVPNTDIEFGMKQMVCFI